MNLRLALAAIVLLCGPTSALAHRVDEYLQAAMFNVERDHVNLDLRLTPGIEVFAKVLAAVDLDGDGEISPAEQRTYAEEVRRDLSLSIDGSPAPLKLRSVTFPALAEMKQGLGEIVLDFESADDPRASRPQAGLREPSSARDFRLSGELPRPQRSPYPRDRPGPELHAVVLPVGLCAGRPPRGRAVVRLFVQVVIRASSARQLAGENGQRVAFHGLRLSRRPSHSDGL